MICPTCSSPLPVGAMFCGQCGRSLTSDDVVTRKGTRPPSGEGAEGAETAPPAWRFEEPPAAAVPFGTPWWVADRAADGAEEGIESEQTNHSEEGAGAGASDDPAAQPSDPAAPTSTSAPMSAPAPTSAPGPVAPVPLRPPVGDSSNGPRPTSAPLWTASLTPLTEAAPTGEEPSEADRVSEPTDSGASTDSGRSLDSERSTDSDRSTAAESAPDSPDDASAQPSTEPHEGDTNVIPPLVLPTSDGGVLRCTVCGAALAADDIFCGECGTVVHSVAQSFTGPITPITANSAETPPGESREAQDPGAPGRDDARSDTSTDASARPQSPRPREAPLAPTPVPSPAAANPPFVPEAPTPDKSPKRRRLFGRRDHEADHPVPWTTPTDAEQQTPAPIPAAATPPHDPSEENPPSASPVPLTRDAVPGVPADDPADRSADPEGPSADPESEIVGVGDIPLAPRDEPALPVEAPLAATPVDAPPQTATPVVTASTPAAPPASTSAAPWALGSSIEDVEKTRIVRRRPLGEPFVLQFSTGESFTVQGTGLVGRAPVPQPGEAIDLLVRIIDPGKSVSKTHLEFGQDDGALWISDRWSGNGSIVRDPAHEARRCEPGTRVRVPRGARVDIGEQFFIVS